MREFLVALLIEAVITLIAIVINMIKEDIL